MKEKLIYIISIITTFFIGVMLTICVYKYIPTNVVNTEKTVSEVTIKEDNTLKSAINKVYDATILVETYTDNQLYATGTGFVYKIDDNYGYILTNNHVISDGNSFKILTNSGNEFDAELLGSDVYTDVAVLKVDASNVTMAVTFGSSEDAEIGDTIFTVGTPISSTFIGSVTKGILSGKDRAVTLTSGTSTFMMSVLQMDAAVNPGNSGGPLCNANGEVIGIVNSKVIQDQVEGIGFAIPIETVESIIDRLENNEKIVRPLLGLEVSDLSNTYTLYSENIEIDDSIESGIVVVNVNDNTPAATAKFQKGDVIIKLNDDDITSVTNFRYNLYKYNVGDTITITYIRDGKENKVEVNLNKSTE